MHDVPFYGRTHTSFFFLSLSLFRRRLLLLPLFSLFFSTSISSSFSRGEQASFSRKVHPLVTRTLCGAASIKPHFYSGALHSLRSVRLPPTFHGSLLHKRERGGRGHRGYFFFGGAQPLEKYSNSICASSTGNFNGLTPTRTNIANSAEM